MGTWNTALAQHGYSILIAVVFLETIGLPVPAALALLIAGGAAARGVLQIPYVLSSAFLAMLAGDTLMFLLGHYTGCWLLGVLCRISLNPETCIMRSADSFYRCRFADPGYACTTSVRPSSARICSRIKYFCTLPLMVRGKASTNRT